jgi:hypothetical protein
MFDTSYKTMTDSTRRKKARRKAEEYSIANRRKYLAEQIRQLERDGKHERSGDIKKFIESELTELREEFDALVSPSTRELIEARLAEIEQEMLTCTDNAKAQTLIAEREQAQSDLLKV